MIEAFDLSMLYLSQDIFFNNDDDTPKSSNDADTNITFWSEKKNSSV